MYHCLRQLCDKEEEEEEEAEEADSACSSEKEEVIAGTPSFTLCSPPTHVNFFSPLTGRLSGSDSTT